MGSASSSTEHHRCKCGHLKHVHSKIVGSCNSVPCKCQVFVCDHSRCGWKPRVEKPECQHPNKHVVGARYSAVDGEIFYTCPDCKAKWEEPWTPPVEPPKCSWGEHGFKPFQGHGDEPGKPHCLTCGHVWGACSWHWSQVEEPPMTPEEEEQAPEDADKPICGRCYTDHAQGSCEPAEAPPQPDRRPPHIVAYSVSGHLYEVAVSGDATVSAVDGALIIQHSLGPVAGIAHVGPFTLNEEKA